MSKEHLNNLKQKPCLRLNYEAIKKSRDRLFEHYRNLYPHLFEGLTRPMFELPTGWVRAVGETFQKLEDLGVKLLQVKQKFGDLRIYFREPTEPPPHVSESWCDYINAKAREAVAEAEYRASGMCEFCGSENTVSLWEVGYVARVCVECKEALAEYHILSWVYEDKRGLDSPGIMNALQYSKKVLREIEEGLVSNRKSFYETYLAGITR